MAWQKNEYRESPSNSKRKRKSYLAKERAQAKRGRFGRGYHVDEETFRYLLHVLEVKLCDFSSPEDRDIFINNVLEQTVGKELEISCNQLGSRAMEKFLPFANDEILFRFSNIFSEDLRKICFEEFGSHVIQELIVIFSSRLQNIEESQSSASEMPQKFKTWLEEVCKFVVNNLEEFMQNTFANHVLRTVLECLSGLPPGSTSKEKKWEKKAQLASQEIKLPPIDEGHDLVRKSGKCILHMSHINDFVYTDITSGFLQTLLGCVHKVDSKLTHRIVKHLLNHCFAPETQNLLEGKDENDVPADEVPTIFMNPAATRLMDVMLSVATGKTFSQIYARCFVNKLVPLSLAPHANFCVQNLIRHCSKRIQFKAMFDELSSEFEKLLQSQRFGVVLALGQTCQRLGRKEGEFIKKLKSALHCALPEQQGIFPLLVAYCVDYETWSKNSDENGGPALPVTNIGSLLLQTLLNFSNPAQIVKALLMMDIEYLKSLLCTCYGSYVADVFFASTTVGQKSKDKFFQKLQGSFVELVICKFGSRVLDTIWNLSPLNKKILILEELAPVESMVKGVRQGSFFCKKSGLSLFKLRRKDWEDSHTQGERAQKLFADIIGT